MQHRPRKPGRRRTWLAGAAIATVGAVGAWLALAAPFASATASFRDDFESGGASGWAKSGGTWSVVVDGSHVLRQDSASAGLAREFAGGTGWTDYSLTARVKPLTLNAAGSFVGIAIRARSNTTFYRLALFADRVELQSVRSGAVTVLGGATRDVAAGTWYTLRLDTTARSVTGYVDGVAVASGTSTVSAAGRLGLQTYQARGEFDDVAAGGGSAIPSTGTATAGPIATPSATVPSGAGPSGAGPSGAGSSGAGSSGAGSSGAGSSAGGWGSPAPAGGSGGAALQGFAAISGAGRGPTTGGAAGPTVTVTSLAQLTAEAAKAGAETIRVSGLFAGSGEVPVGSDKTVVGVGASSGLTGIGLSVKGQHNVIIRNLNISKVTAASGDGDSIHVESSDHVWVDHNNLFSDMSHGKDYYDGQVDLTHAADYVTVSWNTIHDHYKLSLVGHSDSNGAEDTGHLHVTYHHNYFSTFDSRTPSVRFGTGHVYDNYFVDGITGVHSRDNAQLLVQNNVFRNVGTPIETTGDSPDGYVNQSGNDFGGGTNTITRTGTFTTAPYTYHLDPTGSVIALVTAGAGTGRI